jgi:hypothetical protein
MLASPGWRNASSTPVSGGPALARRLAEAINLRSGAKVRIAKAGALGCHYATELVLLPAHDAQGQSILVLALRVVRPGARSVFVEEAVTIGQLKPEPRPGLLFQASAPSGPKEVEVPPSRAFQDIAFEHGQVGLDSTLASEHLSILGERTWRDSAGLLRVEIRLLSRLRDMAIGVLAYYIDGEGRRHPPMKVVHQALPASRPATLSLALPKMAQLYHVFILVP